MHKNMIERMMEDAERVFHHELHIVEEILGHPHPRHVRKRMHLAFTSITFSNNQKIGGIIMDFILNKDNPIVKLVLQALDKDGNILPTIDTVTGRPTLKPGTIQVTCDNPGIKVDQDPSDPTLVTVSRVDNVTTASGTLSAKATNDEDAEVDGSSVVNEVADPVIDNGIAASLQFAPAPAVTV